MNRSGGRIWAAVATGVLAVSLLGAQAGPASAASSGKVTFLAGIPVSVVQQIATTLNPPPPPPVFPLTPVPEAPLSGLLDIYDGKTLVADNVKADTFVTVTVATGMHTFNVYADGQEPGTAKALLSKSGVDVAAEGVQTVAVGLNRDGNAAVGTVYRNDFPFAPGGGNAWMIVRQVAATGALDVKVNGKTAFTGMKNGTQAILAVPPADYAIKVMGGEGKATTLAKDDSFVVSTGKVAILYVWGSAAASHVKTATQTLAVG